VSGHGLHGPGVVGPRTPGTPYWRHVGVCRSTRHQAQAQAQAQARDRARPRPRTKPTRKSSGKYKIKKVDGRTDGRTDEHWQSRHVTLRRRRTDGQSSSGVTVPLCCAAAALSAVWWVVGRRGERERAAVVFVWRISCRGSDQTRPRLFQGWLGGEGGGDRVMVLPPL
jgi:hypothetical protein